MKTLQRFKLGLLVVGTLMLTTPATQALADQLGPYYATPSWDQTLPAATRFIVLSNMNSDAVLDRETGLIWEKSPSTSTFTWSNAGASFHCNQLVVGNRLGWKLPTMQELATLVDGDPGNLTRPRLPPGHPFLNVQGSIYWTASTFDYLPSFAWTMNLNGGNVGGFIKSAAHFVWCVRGGPGLDLQ